MVIVERWSSRCNWLNGQNYDYDINAVEISYMYIINVS